MNKYIADKSFYKKTASLALPFALQSLLMSCQSTIDTLMVTKIGMVSAVGTAAQIDTLSSMISYGCIGGIAMFSAQFYGAKDYKNLKRCFGLSLLLVLSNACLWFLMATFGGRAILNFYMADQSVVDNGLLYLNIAKYSYFFGALNFAFSNMFRSTGKGQISLRVSLLSTITNILFNYLLIFGKGPFPAMGIKGAALGTIIAQTVSISTYLIVSLKTKQAFLGNFNELFRLNYNFVKPIFARILPLILNESVFGFGQTLFVKAFGYLGKQQMDAYYVGNQIFNLLTFIIYGYGNAVQVLLGMQLGKGNIEEAKKECDYHIGLATFLSICLVIIMYMFARPLVHQFGLSDPYTAELAVKIVYVFAVKASMRLYNFMIFCILRSGGDAKIIQLLDSGLQWAIGLPLAYLSVKVFNIKDIAIVLLITQFEQLVRLILGMHRVKSYKWAKDLTKVIS